MNIGSLSLKNQVVLAPMAGITDLPYRIIMKSMGAALVFSEMISANGLVRNGGKTWELLASDRRERPIGIQLFGDNPEVLAEAAKRVEERGDLIDINMGCPVPKVTRSGAGSALMKDLAKAAKIITTVRKSVKLPLTIKIRSGWDSSSINFIEFGRMAQEEGVNAVILHPRTRSQGFGGAAAWEHIAELKSSLDIPVIGSGDIQKPADALAMLRRTDCDAVMIGRGGYGNPWLIRDTIALIQGRTPHPVSHNEQLHMALAHLDLFREIHGDHLASYAMRKHICWYSRGISGAASFRTLINRCESVEALRQETIDFFCSANETLARSA